MSKLVEELRSEHARLVDVLNKINELGYNTSEGQGLLMSAKNALFAHLKKEDSEFYPALKNVQEENALVKKMLINFSTEMEAITPVVVAFFDKYSKGGAGMEFAKDFGQFISALKSRIWKEEHILYPEYDKLNK